MASRRVASTSTFAFYAPIQTAGKGSRSDWPTLHETKKSTVCARARVNGAKALFIEQIPVQREVC